MTQEEMAEGSRKALEWARSLPPGEWLKRLIASGTINERGEVLMGRDDLREEQASKTADMKTAAGDAGQDKPQT